MKSIQQFSYINFSYNYRLNRFSASTEACYHTPAMAIKHKTSLVDIYKISNENFHIQTEIPQNQL